MADIQRLVAIGINAEKAKVLNEEFGGSLTADDITVGEITSDAVTFPGGTLTEALQAIADAIPSA